MGKLASFQDNADKGGKLVPPDQKPVPARKSIRDRITEFAGTSLGQATGLVVGIGLVIASFNQNKNDAAPEAKPGLHPRQDSASHAVYMPRKTMHDINP